MPTHYFGRKGMTTEEGGNKDCSTKLPPPLLPLSLPSFPLDKLKLRLKNEGLTWTLSADEDDEAEGRRWADALATAVARLGSLSKGHPPGGHGEGTRELAHNPARKVVVIEVGGQGERV